MTPQDLKAFRARMGWTRSELSQRLDVSPSRLADYERGATRTTPPRPAPIPKVVELALRQLERDARPLTAMEKVAEWRDDSLWVSPHPGPAADTGRAAIYRDNERGF